MVMPNLHNANERGLRDAEEVRLRDAEVRIISNFEMWQVVSQLPKLETIKTTSFPTINKIVDGFIQGELVVITGATGCGKTLLCQTLTKDFCDDMHTPLWFTFEVSPRFFLPKFALNGIDLQFYMPEHLIPYSIDWIKHVILKAKFDKDIDVVFIDHLHYIFDMSRSIHASLDIGMVVRALKRICVENDIVIFLCCHTTKSKVENRDDIGLHKIRDSSLVAQEADTVLFVHRDTVEDGICKTDNSFVKVCKARRTGDMGTVVETVKRNNYLKEVYT